MNELQIFSNPAFGEIRVTDQNGEPWFVAADVVGRWISEIRHKQLPVWIVMNPPSFQMRVEK